MNDLFEKSAAPGPLAERTSIPLLKIPYASFVVSLNAVVSDWLDGKIGTGCPEEEWEKEQIRSVNDKVNAVKPATGSDEETGMKTTYDAIVRVKVPSHLKIVTSHRKWIRNSFSFLKIIGVSFSEKMERLIKIHDLSKYTHREVLGYAVMFEDGQTDWKNLEEENEKLEWQTTLTSHYAYNPHHPEYFYPKLEDGSRDKSKSMMDLNPENGRDYLIESLIDMLASRGERILRGDPEFSVQKWMDIAERYLGRYGDKDKAFVVDLLEQWRYIAEEFMKADENVAKLCGHFDQRRIVD